MTDRARRDAEPLKLGADVVQRLIPHRRPLVMVDGVIAYRHAPKPTLWARRQISANEDIFNGHFPGYSLWPGVYTIEGLGQTTLICAIVAYLVTERVARGGKEAEIYDALRTLERQAAQPFGASTAELDFGGATAPRAGMAGHVDIKFLAPVFAGATLEYCVTMTHVMAPLARFDVEATVDGNPVARGTMTGMIGPAAPVA